MALRVVVLGRGKAVVDEERRAAMQRLREGGDEGLRLRVDLGHGAGRERAVVRWAQRRSAGRTTPAHAAASSATPRSNQARRQQASSCTGIASSTSLPTTTASMRAGQRSSHCTRSPKPRQPLGLARAQRGRQLDDAVATQLRAQCVEQGARPARPSRRRTRRTVSVSLASSACDSCRASAWPNSGVSSGAVTKSLPAPGQRPNCAVVRSRSSPGRRVQRQRHETVERQPAAPRHRWPARITACSRLDTLCCCAVTLIAPL